MQRTYPEGVPSWVDTEQPDVEAAMAFYGAVLGWTFVPATPPGDPFRYVIAQLDGADVAGLGGPAEPPADRAGVDGDGGAAPTWNTYVAVDDADAAASRVAELGGTVSQPPTPAGEGGRSVVATDPFGAQVRLWEARRRLGAQVANVPGAWNFSELHTADPTAAAGFYGALF
ncbi:VOC family protein, partial [Intrasporangium flavum]|uniref:VOC family protein n=1 Tax=Intrasporangium flavum TaxID=1428657 RepID=UPI001A966F1C